MPILDRRQFLSTGAAGAAVLACPPWLASCAGSLAVVPATDAPSTPGASFERFGVPRELLGKVLGRGLSRGGDFAEVFLQHKVTHTLGLEDGAVDRAFTEVSLGAGLRVLKGDATGYAFTEDLSEAALLQAAGTAAAVADGGPAEASAPLEVRAIANA
jgi:TldD protein